MIGHPRFLSIAEQSIALYMWQCPVLPCPVLLTWILTRGSSFTKLPATHNEQAMFRFVEFATIADYCLPLAAELVLEVENKTPLRDSFKFARLMDGICIAGSYVLQYEMQPCLPGGPLTLEVQLTVAPGPAAQVLIQVSI